MHFRSMLKGIWLASLALALGCEVPPAQVKDTSLPIVTVAKPLARMVTDREDFTGQTEAVDSVEIRARVSGYLEKVCFQEGVEVKKDQLLYEIDRRPYQAEVDQGKANVGRSEAAQKRAQAEYDRAKRLQGMGGQAISPEEVERAVAMRDEAIASVAGAKAALEKAELNLKFTRVLAPVAGRVSRTRVTEGNLVTADSTLLTTVVSQAPIYATFDVDDRTMLRLQRMAREGKVASARDKNAKLPILLGLLNEVGYPHVGEIDFVDNAVDPGTGTLKVRGVFANKEGTLAPGLSVRIRLPVGKPHEALLVAERALGVDQGQKYLLVVEKGKDGKDVVSYRSVRTGETQDGLRVIEEGLKPDDQVIVVGMQRVRPGVAVDAKVEAMPTRESDSNSKPNAGKSAPPPAEPTKPAAPAKN